MNDILDAVSARIKAPYFGYALLAFITLNWRGIFLLMATAGTPTERLQAFDAETSHWTLFALPFLIGALVTVSVPWLKLLFGFISKKPFEVIDNINLDSDHKKTIRRTELERSRSIFFAEKETELIDRAKRDAEVQEIDNEELKERLTLELEMLRRERDAMSKNLYESKKGTLLPPAEIEMLKAAARHGDGSILRIEYIDGPCISIGETTFGKDSPRNFSKYHAALKSLLSKELVQEVGNEGMLFELTNSGWQIAEPF